MNKFEFEDFKKSDSALPTEELSKKVLNIVKDDIEPRSAIVFSKLLAIQTLVGFLTLTLCPQFSLSLTNKHELFHYFHYKFGESICMMICGSIFIGTGAIVAAYVLKKSEVQKIRSSTFLYYFTITSIALASFTMIGTEIYLRLASLWFLGALIAGMSMFELNFRLRKMVFYP